MKAIIIFIVVMLIADCAYAIGVETMKEKKSQGRNPSDWFVDYGVYVFIAVIFGVIVGCFTAYVADRKGYSPGAWYWLGFFFGLIALIAVAGLPQEPEEEEEEEKDWQ